MKLKLTVIISVIAITFAIVAGCGPYHSGGAKYLYMNIDPSTNATKMMQIESVRNVGPTTVKIVCTNGDNITIETEGFQPGPSDVGTALGIVDKSVSALIETSKKAGTLAK